MTPKIALLTLPLHHNYGGILQIVALYTFLKANKFNPIFLNNRPARGIKGRLAEAILPWIPGQNFHGVRDAETKRRLHRAFINKHMPNRSSVLRTSNDFSRFVSQNDIDAVVVGSDQVWRLQYHYDNEHMIYFFDFLETTQSTKRIAYAASFGHENWIYSDHTKRVTSLLKKFDHLSVREERGQFICEKEFDQKAVELVLDPTMIVDDTFYQDIVKTVEISKNEYRLNYVLDQSEATLSTLQAVSRQYQHINSIDVKEYSPNVDIPKWLAYFKNSNFVVTDSFHGTVFSILFKKNFITIGNKDRGLDRFKTLLGQLGLLDRLITDQNHNVALSKLNEPIDYSSVSTRLGALRAHSKEFLLRAISTPSS